MTYHNFIQQCFQRQLPDTIYTERHHILPRCMGGTNDKNNIIRLTHQEHYEAHKLLALEYPTNEKLQYAWWNMSVRHNKYQEEIFVSADDYARARELHAHMTSKQFKGTKQSVEHIQKRTEKQRGLHRTEETRKKLSESLKGKLCGEKNPMYNRPLIGQSLQNMIEHQPHSKKVLCIDTGIEYRSVSAAHKATGCDRKSIDYCCKGIYKQANGYHWKYI